MQKSSIEWTEATWNPVRGCTEVSPGCARCYAKVMAERFRGTPGHAYEQGFDLRLVPHLLDDPLHWRDSRMIFVNSMSDLFHKDIPDEYIRDVVDVMLMAKWHIFQVLTKRSERMRDMLYHTLRDGAEAQHIWWGVSVENKKHGLPRIRHLQEAPATMRFLSMEPLLEPLGKLNLRGIKQVIVGGESGRRPRIMKEEWVWPIQKQCHDKYIPFFFKQWGGTRKGQAGRKLGGKTYSEMPKVTFNPLPPHQERLDMIADIHSRIEHYLQPTVELGTEKLIWRKAE